MNNLKVYLARTLVHCYMNHTCSILNTLLQYGILDHHMPAIFRFTAITTTQNET